MICIGARVLILSNNKIDSLIGSTSFNYDNHTHYTQFIAKLVYCKLLGYSGIELDWVWTSSCALNQTETGSFDSLHYALHAQRRLLELCFILI